MSNWHFEDASYEQHLVLGCLALLGIGERYKGLVGEDAVTMVQFKQQHDTRAVAHFIKEWMDACVCTHGDPGPQSQASNQPLGN